MLLQPQEALFLLEQVNKLYKSARERGVLGISMTFEGVIGNSEVNC